MGVRAKLTGIAASLVLLALAAAHAQNERAAPSPGATLGAEVAMLFDARLARADAYSEWVYEWAASYVAAYKIAGRILVSFVTEPSGWIDNVQKPLDAFYGDEIRQRVTRPEETSSALVEIVDRHTAAQMFMIAHTAAADACGKSGGPACRRARSAEYDAMALDIMTQRRTPAVRAARQAAYFNLVDTQANEDLYWFRAIRPLASRTIIFFLRLTELASVGILISRFLQRLTVPNTLPTQIFAALLFAWGLDYVVHEIDRSLHQGEFQTKFEQSIDAPRDNVLAYVQNDIVNVEKLLRDRIADAGRK